MSSEKKEILTALIVGITEVMLNVLSIVVQKDFLIIGSVCLSIVFGILVFVIYFKYRCLSNSYKLIQFLFFGSEYNTFNFLPKLILYMDYLGDKNDVEIGTVEFECINDNTTKRSDVKWVMKNVSNKTKKEINSYYLYSSSDLGTTNRVQVNVHTGSEEHCKVNVDAVKEKHGVRKTPFTFIKPIKPNESLPEIKISMEMFEAFDFSRQEVVYLYPRNYGKKVEHILIKYKTKGVAAMDVQLHEIGKRGNAYIDTIIKNSQPTYEEKSEEIVYNFSLDEKQINMDSVYYLLIKK